MDQLAKLVMWYNYRVHLTLTKVEASLPLSHSFFFFFNMSSEHINSWESSQVTWEMSEALTRMFPYLFLGRIKAWPGFVRPQPHTISSWHLGVELSPLRLFVRSLGVLSNWVSQASTWASAAQFCFAVFLLSIGRTVTLSEGRNKPQLQGFNESELSTLESTSSDGSCESWRGRNIKEL